MICAHLYCLSTLVSEASQVWHRNVLQSRPRLHLFGCFACLTGYIWVVRDHIDDGKENGDDYLGLGVDRALGNILCRDYRGYMPLFSTRSQ